MASIVEQMDLVLERLDSGEWRAVDVLFHLLLMQEDVRQWAQGVAALEPADETEQALIGLGGYADSLEMFETALWAGEPDFAAARAVALEAESGLRETLREVDEAVEAVLD